MTYDHDNCWTEDEHEEALETWMTEADIRYEEEKDRRAEMDASYPVYLNRRTDAIISHHDEQRRGPKAITYGMILGMMVIGAGYGLYEIMWHLAPVVMGWSVGTHCGIAASFWAGILTGITAYRYRNWKPCRTYLAITLLAWALAAHCFFVKGGASVST